MWTLLVLNEMKNTNKKKKSVSERIAAIQQLRKTSKSDILYCGHIDMVGNNNNSY